MSEREVDSRPVSVGRGAYLGVRADIASTLSMVVVSVVVARALGAEGRGVFFLASLLPTYAALIGDLGMSMASLVFGANRRVPLGQLHGIAIGLSLASTCVGVGALLPFEAFWTDGILRGLDTTTLTLACAAIAPQLYGNVLGALLTGMGRVPVTAALRIGQAVLTPVVLAPVAIVSGSPAWSLAALVAAIVVYAAAIGLYATLRVSPPALPSRATLLTVVLFGARGYIGTLSHHGFLRVDVFFLSARYGPAVVGVYSLASVVAERISLAGQAVYAASAHRMGSDPREEAARLAAQVLRALLLLMLPAALVLGALSWPLFPLIFGDDIAGASLPFCLLLPGTVCLTLWYVASLFIISTLHRPGLTTLIQSTALVLSLPLYYVAVREAEMTGAAIVSSAIYVCVLAMGIAVLVRRSRVGLRDLLPRLADVGVMVRAVRGALASGARA